MNNKELFFKELKELYLKYNISISHEDCHGGFILEKYSNSNWEWIKGANDYAIFKEDSE